METRNLPSDRSLDTIKRKNEGITLERKPVTLKGEIVRCKGCEKILYEGDKLFEYPNIPNFMTGFDYSYCSQECALKNAIIFCVGCGKRLREGDTLHILVKHVSGKEEEVIQTINFFCDECKE